MTDTLTLVAGRELDALIATKVMGKPADARRIARYSTSMEAAWLVVAKISRDYRVSVTGGGTFNVCTLDDAFVVFICESAETAPLAICRAALKFAESHL